MAIPTDIGTGTDKGVFLNDCIMSDADIVAKGGMIADPDTGFNDAVGRRIASMAPIRSPMV